MKAYICFVGDEPWCDLIHGETTGKAKRNFQKWGPLSKDDMQWTDIRLTRLPGQDDKPFTFENAKAAGFVYTDEESAYLTDDQRKQEFTNDCNCEICRPELHT